MGGQPKREEMSYELRVFLSEVGEVVREYLEKNIAGVVQYEKTSEKSKGYRG